jgi:hypothetical protein
VSLLTENGDTKDDLRLPTDDQLLTQVALLLIQTPLLFPQTSELLLCRNTCLMMDVGACLSHLAFLTEGFEDDFIACIL